MNHVTCGTVSINQAFDNIHVVFQVTSFPGPTQLSVTCNTEKQFFVHMPGNEATFREPIEVWPFYFLTHCESRNEAQVYRSKGFKIVCDMKVTIT